jgi:hypothetical protein
MPSLMLALALLAASATPPATDPAITPAIVSLEDLSRADRQHIDRYNLCGMLVRAQARQPGGVMHEWDVAMSVVRRGEQPVAAVEAAAFAFERHPEDRVVRAPLAEMSFAVEGAAAPGAARMVDGPNSDGGMVGELATVTAEQVFDALDAGASIRVDLTYVNGLREAIVLQTRGARSFWGRFSHGHNAPARLCLAKLVEASQPLGPTRRVAHPR